MRRRELSIVAVVALLLLGNLILQRLLADEPVIGLTRPLNFADLTGQVHQLGPDVDRTALVLVLLSTECPISNSYISLLNRLHFEWAQLDRRVDLIGLISDSSLTRAAAVAHSAEFKLAFPVLFDGSGELAGLLKPTHTPEAFVLDAQGQLVYRGRIDDTYADVGKRRLEPTSHEVRDAVEALLKGEPVNVAVQPPVGCLFEERDRKNDNEEVTFNREIAPIIHANCTSCHREGEVAPFPLLTYQDVSKRAGQIASVIDSGLMPPWRPAIGTGHFLGERRLTATAKQLIARWAESGRAEGKPEDRPQPPQFPSGWRLGKPDLVLKMPEAFTIPADGPDIFQNFVLPMNLETDHFVVAAEFKPGNARVVHHSIFYLDRSRVARRLDEQDPKPGYATFGGPGFLPTGAVGGWSPGTTPRILPGGYCRYAAGGSDLVLQIHYHPTGREETDQSEIGLYFREQPKNVVANVTLSNFGFQLKAGENDKVVSGEYTLPQDVSLVGLTPHMHLLGRQMRVVATYPDGATEDLIWIRDWHFYWQDQYYLQTAKRLPKGTTLRMEARYDNSASNPFNPSSPPRDVTFGEQTTDEMCFCFCLVATDSPTDLKPLVMDNIRHVVQQRIKGRLGQFPLLQQN
ncbi:redoxin domain-containing protein [bacterium]|nr:redoxin domain-containing protein [bacterium]